MESGLSHLQSSLVFPYELTGTWAFKEGISQT
jgi:hypothetical protein